MDWHRGGVQHLNEETVPGPARANHLALTAHGLPSEECPSGDWMVDVGLGDGLYGPLPLREGTYSQGPFSYRLRRSEAAPGGWRFDHDPAGSFAGMDFEPQVADVPDFQARHRYLSTSPESGFVRTCVIQRCDATGVDTLRGCVLHRIGSDPSQRVLDTPADWFAALTDLFGLSLDDFTPADRARLWRRVHATHQAWLATSP